MDICNRPAWYQDRNGLRLCLEHRPVLWPNDQEWEHMVNNPMGPCDFDLDTPPSPMVAPPNQRVPSLLTPCEKCGWPFNSHYQHTGNCIDNPPASVVVPPGQSTQVNRRGELGMPNNPFRVTECKTFNLLSCDKKRAEEARGLMGFHNFVTCPDCVKTFEGYAYWGENGHKQATLREPADAQYIAQRKWVVSPGSPMYYRGN
jgi:hypothetical protein